MIFDIKIWLDEIEEKLKRAFGSRLLFLGLQGSYNRNEADVNSDIDLVVILDELEFEDLKIYKNIIDSMPHKEKACGFISGKSEILNWSRADLFQFYYDTRAILGTLDGIVNPPQKDDILKSLKTSFENLYHTAVHAYLHSQYRSTCLCDLYKMTFFILQSKYFVENNEYVPTKKLLVDKLISDDKEILQICLNKNNLANLSADETEEHYKKLIAWCKRNLL